MIQQTLLKEGRADKVEAVVGKLHYSGLQLDPTTTIEHMRQRYSPDFLGQSVRDQAIEKALGIRARDLDLCKGRNVHNTNGFADGPAFQSDHIVDFIAAERVMIALLHTILCKPTWAFVAKDLFVDRAFFFQALIKR